MCFDCVYTGRKRANTRHTRTKGQNKAPNLLLPSTDAQTHRQNTFLSDAHEPLGRFGWGPRVGRSRRRFAVLYVSLRCLDFRLTLTATKAGNSMPRNNGGATQVESRPGCKGQPSENPTTNANNAVIHSIQDQATQLACVLRPLCLRTCVYMHVTRDRACSGFKTRRHTDCPH